MAGFRFVALGYALLVFLIAPAWLAAEEEPESPAPVATVEDSVTAVQEAVPDVPDLPVETPVTASDQADDPEPDPATEGKQNADETNADEKKKDPAAKEPSAKAASSASVTISDFKFTPDTVTVNEGDTVTWTNDGPSVHTATAEDGSFDTGALNKGESGSATFTQAGTISYICSPHPFMHGKVVVQAASAGSGSGSGSGGGTGTGSGSGSTDDTGSGVAGEETSADSGTSGLPYTGAEALSIALLGMATLGFGLLLRSRHRDDRA
jgi:LPXTG-motif cell wall-anchored protein